jgi:hypothetical protein
VLLHLRQAPDQFRELVFFSAASAVSALNVVDRGYLM